MDKVSIVVSRYNENLGWINEYPFNQFKYIVYNKGDNDNFEKSNVAKIIKLDNIGRGLGGAVFYPMIHTKKIVQTDLPRI